MRQMTTTDIPLFPVGQAAVLSTSLAERFSPYDEDRRDNHQEQEMVAALEDLARAASGVGDSGLPGPAFAQEVRRLQHYLDLPRRRADPEAAPRPGTDPALQQALWILLSACDEADEVRRRLRDYLEAVELARPRGLDRVLPHHWGRTVEARAPRQRETYHDWGRATEAFLQAHPAGSGSAP